MKVFSTITVGLGAFTNWLRPHSAYNQIFTYIAVRGTGTEIPFNNVKGGLPMFTTSAAGSPTRLYNWDVPTIQNGAVATQGLWQSPALTAESSFEFDWFPGCEVGIALGQVNYNLSGANVGLFSGFTPLYGTLYVPLPTPVSSYAWNIRTNFTVSPYPHSNSTAFVVWSVHVFP